MKVLSKIGIILATLFVAAGLVFGYLFYTFMKNENTYLKSENETLKVEVEACKSALSKKDTVYIWQHLPPSSVSPYPKPEMLVSVEKPTVVIIGDTIIHEGKVYVSSKIQAGLPVIVWDTINVYKDSIVGENYVIGYKARTRGVLMELNIDPKIKYPEITSSSVVYVPVPAKDEPKELQLFGTITKSINDRSTRLGVDVTFNEKYKVIYFRDVVQKTHNIGAGIKLYER